MFSLLSILLAALGLGFLIFIHEFGHYWMARKQGMTVEVFSIGFGKPIYIWEYQGVKWQFCILPFGGYVRIAGMEKKGALEPYQIPDGFYGKKPFSRIKVALSGPVVNILFAFLAFTSLWLSGGRLKPFSEYTKIIGWVDPSSSLYQADVRPGDQIKTLNGHPFHQFQDLLYAAVLDHGPLKIEGTEVDYFANQKVPFNFTFPLSHQESTAERISTVWDSFAPASYLLYHRYPAGKGKSLGAGSPMQESGISYDDRILWVDGDLVFSKQQLISVVNQAKALLTIERKGQFFLARVPRLKTSDLRIDSHQKSELIDWQYAVQMKGKLSDVFFIPYDLKSNGVVEKSLTYLNDETIEQQPSHHSRTPIEAPLLKGDRIVAVDGVAVTSAQDILKELQMRHVHIIVKTNESQTPLSWDQADEAFVAGIDWNALNRMVQSIGTSFLIKEEGNLKLLSPIVPTPRNEYPYPEDIKMRIAKGFEEQRKQIEKISDPEEKAHALKLMEDANHQLMLGIVPIDRQVVYNPSPFVLFSNVFKETWRTLVALFSGHVSPKYMQGPVGIVQVMHYSWTVGVKEALFWLGMISLNLGILNLLPIPILDGGHICFSLWEAITKKPIQSKTMERLIIPFVVLLVVFFIYLTYHDLERLLSRFF